MRTIQKGVCCLQITTWNVVKSCFGWNKLKYKKDTNSAIKKWFTARSWIWWKANIKNQCTKLTLHNVISSTPIRWNFFKQKLIEYFWHCYQKLCSCVQSWFFTCRMSFHWKVVQARIFVNYDCTCSTSLLSSFKIKASIG